MMTVKEKRLKATELLRRQPWWSNHRLGREIGVSWAFIAKMRQRLSIPAYGERYAIRNGVEYLVNVEPIIDANGNRIRGLDFSGLLKGSV